MHLGFGRVRHDLGHHGRQHALGQVHGRGDVDVDDVQLLTLWTAVTPTSPPILGPIRLI